MEIRGVPAATTVLDWLRGQAGLRGTKEGCAEGDCGACTVVVERLRKDGSIAHEPINACISLIGQLDGLGLRTVEGLAANEHQLHPVQAAFVESGGTQCGFCTPGFVMSAYAFAASAEPRQPAHIHDALAGNLCRCTGYRPIVDAMMKAAPAVDPLERGRRQLAADLKQQARRRPTRFEHEGRWFQSPTTLEEALTLRAKHPDALVIAGGTDLGLRISRQREKLPALIHLGRIAALRAIKTNTRRIVLGAGTTCAQALEVLAPYYPGLVAYLTRFGSRQIRNLATIGGNIATASPIGDMAPILLALDAGIRLRSSAHGTRELAAEQFFVGYRKTALAKDELIESIVLPRPMANSIVVADKISKRRDQDISTVCAAYRLSIENGRIGEVRLAFGGLAETPRRAYAAEAVLQGQVPAPALFAAAGDRLGEDFRPISDWRGSAAYRSAVAKNLLQRLGLRVTEPSVPLELDAL